MELRIKLVLEQETTGEYKQNRGNNTSRAPESGRRGVVEARGRAREIRCGTIVLTFSCEVMDCIN